MKKKNLSRREFLKAVVAGAAAGGLSHFRVLNFGGAEEVLADNYGCDIGVADYCNPGEDEDVCPDPNQATGSDICAIDLGEPDVCAPEEGAVDICDPTTEPPEPDECGAVGDLDTCGWENAPDVCGEGPAVPDTCDTFNNNPDVCPDGPGGDGDICNETAPNASPDECVPALGEPDECYNTADPDFCRNPETGQVGTDICDPDHGDPDLCAEPGGNAQDICDPGNDNPDDPNPVTLTSLTGATSVLPALGAAAAGLGWAALRSARREEDEKDTPLED